jgi:ATP-dependent Clp protease ATP-binding subunit ClpA
VVERFSDRARRVLALAQEEAHLLGHHWLGTEHVLLGLRAEDAGGAAQVLDALDLTLDDLREAVRDLVGVGPGVVPAERLAFTPRVRRVLELALTRALRRGSDYIGTTHLLLGTLDEGAGTAWEVLQKLSIDCDHLERLLDGPVEPEEQPLHRNHLGGRPRRDIGDDRPRGRGLERLSDQALRALVEARATRRSLGLDELEPEHLLAGLLALEADPVAARLTAAGVGAAALRAVLDRCTPPGGYVLTGGSRLSAATWRVLEAAGAQALGPVGTEELLAALLRTSSAARLAVAAAGGDLTQLQEWAGARNTYGVASVEGGPGRLGMTDTNR